MLQASEQESLAFEAFSSFGKLFWAESALAHLLDSGQPIAELYIFSLVTSPPAKARGLLSLARELSCFVETCPLWFSPRQV